MAPIGISSSRPASRAGGGRGECPREREGGEEVFLLPRRGVEGLPSGRDPRRLRDRARPGRGCRKGGPGHAAASVPSRRRHRRPRGGRTAVPFGTGPRGGEERADDPALQGPGRNEPRAALGDRDGPGEARPAPGGDRRRDRRRRDLHETDGRPGGAAEGFHREERPGGFLAGYLTGRFGGPRIPTPAVAFGGGKGWCTTGAGRR